MGEILLEWTQQERIDSFEYEVTDLNDVDIGFGNYLARIIQSQRLNAINRTDKAAERFFNAPLSEVLFLAEYEEPKRFIRKLVGNPKSRKQDTDNAPADSKRSINKRALPVMYYYRNKGIYPTDRAEDNIERKVAIDATGEESRLYADISYSVFILTNDKSTLDRIANSFLMAFNFDAKKFESKSSLDGRPFDITSYIKEHNTIGWDDAGVPSSEGRLFAYMANIPVKTHVCRYHHQSERDVTYQLLEPQPRFK